jgi:hypothetical protein
MAADSVSKQYQMCWARREQQACRQQHCAGQHCTVHHKCAHCVLRALRLVSGRPVCERTMSASRMRQTLLPPGGGPVTVLLLLLLLPHRAWNLSAPSSSAMWRLSAQCWGPHW